MFAVEPKSRLTAFAALAGLSLIALGRSQLNRAAGESTQDKLAFVRVAPDQRGFVLEPSGRSFLPWGFNYDHDETSRLIEEYWHDEWPNVEEDFREMKQLGANVVRVHLQFGKFMTGPDEPNEKELNQLSRLLALAEDVGLYLDITGLACYLKAYVPAWYDELDESGRWSAQARFWEAVAARCADSPAVFCYDLMNEPVAPGGKRKPGDWLGPPFADRFHFVQMIALDQQDRSRPAIAREWVKTLVAAIRKHDRRHLITVGLVDWSLDRPGLTSGFVPKEIVGELDFLCVHIYPRKGKVGEAIETLRGFGVGKPVVIEETFPLHAGMPDFQQFIERSRSHAAGWIGFYWGKTIDECRRSGTIADAIVANWLEYFQKEAARARD
jgi:hypothetical protein